MKIIANSLNEELINKDESLGILSYDSPSGLPEYFVEAPGINFQTPFEGAEFDYEDMWRAGGDGSFTFAEIKFNGKYFGNSTFQKKYIGKKFSITIENKNYSGEFTEKTINLN